MLKKGGKAPLAVARMAQIICCLERSSVKSEYIKVIDELTDTAVKSAIGKKSKQRNREIGMVFRCILTKKKMPGWVRKSSSEAAHRTISWARASR